MFGHTYIMHVLCFLLVLQPYTYDVRKICMQGWGLLIQDTDDQDIWQHPAWFTIPCLLST